MSIPNTLTLLRILLIPLFAIAFLYGMRMTALLIFAVAALTDALDGFLARCNDQQTKLGSLMDPLADKMLLLTGFILMGISHEMPHWCLVLVISREVVILFGWMVRHLITRSTSVTPSILGKATTLLQVVALVVLLLGHERIMPYHVSEILLYTAMAATAISGIDYLFRGLKELEPRKTSRDN
jgi:cardiolipin synthase